MPHLLKQGVGKDNSAFLLGCLFSVSVWTDPNCYPGTVKQCDKKCRESVFYSHILSFPWKDVANPPKEVS